mmetsp:Transcript_6420/g.19384  ORF Transcript_6420/g.19384 Transcript_6420/m.19384 type:complete len:203 (+) Transcript_6420:1243-1851(+)
MDLWFWWQSVQYNCLVYSHSANPLLEPKGSGAPMTPKGRVQVFPLILTEQPAHLPCWTWSCSWADRLCGSSTSRRTDWPLVSHSLAPSSIGILAWLDPLKPICCRMPCSPPSGDRKRRSGSAVQSGGGDAQATRRHSWRSSLRSSITVALNLRWPKLRNLSSLTSSQGRGSLGKHLLRSDWSFTKSLYRRLSSQPRPPALWT